MWDDSMIGKREKVHNILSTTYEGVIDCFSRNGKLLFIKVGGGLTTVPMNNGDLLPFNVQIIE